MKVLILAAGSAKRWGNYLGTPKQLVTVDGEPLLERTIRQLKARGMDIYLKVPSKGFFGDLGVTEIVTEDKVELDKFINDGGLEDVVYLWGDTYFTEEALHTILNCTDELMFFGRKTPSTLTNKPWRELFAAKGNLKEAAMEVKKINPKYASWHLYAYMSGYPLESTTIGKNFTNIDDRTEDFDFPRDYRIWNLAKFQTEIGECPGMEFYRDQYRFMELGSWEPVLEWLDELKAETLMDLGCGYGALMLYARERLNPKATIGIDNRLYFPLADRYGVDYRILNIEKSEIPTADLTIMTEVFEHLNFHPINVLNKLTGKIILTTPNADKWGRSHYYKHFDDMPEPCDRIIIDDNIYQYTKEEMEELFKRAGLTVLKFEYSNDEKHLCYLLERL